MSATERVDPPLSGLPCADPGLAGGVVSWPLPRQEASACCCEVGRHQVATPACTNIITCFRSPQR